MTVRIKPEHSGRIKILALAGWTPQEIANQYPDYHPDQIRNHLNNKYKEEVKGKVQKDNSRGNAKLLHLLKEIFPNAKVQTEFAIGKKLRLDCYIEDPYNLGFEYDGIQHFKSVDHFGGDDQHIKNIQNDYSKEEICKGRGISLIRISYNENLDIELLRDKIDQAGYGTGIVQDEFKTNKEKKKEKDQVARTHAKRIAKLSYEKNKSKIKNSANYQIQKERARAARKENYQRSKAWAASRRGKS